MTSAYYICYTTRMPPNQTLALREERRELLRELGGLSGLLHGTWVERYSTCSRPGCACHRGKRHGPRHYLVINVNGRQRQRYVPERLAGAVLEGLSQHRRLLEIARRLTDLNLALLRGGGGGTP